MNNVEAATNEQTAPTLTVNVTNDTASLDLVVRDDNGTFASSAASGSNATFTVATNNFTGYTLSIKSSSLSTNLTNTSTNPNSVLETISSSMDSNTFNSSAYNGRWGYLPSKYNSSANTTTYYPSPTAAGTTLDKTSVANSTANSYTMAIGARADYSKPTGTYSNTYVLTTVINGFDYSISYNKGNTTDTVTNLPSAQTASSTSDASVVLSSTEPARNGHAFTGWCSIMPTTSNDADSCSGETYAAGATYYFNKTADNSNIILYAMWRENSPTFDGITTMQQMTPAICANETTPATTATQTTLYHTSDTNYVPQAVLTDTRENGAHAYVVRKLADGNCWMVQNLMLGNSSSSVLLTSSDTDLNTISSYTLVQAETGTSSWYGNTAYYYNQPHVQYNGGKYVLAGTYNGTQLNGSYSPSADDVLSSGTPNDGTQYLGNAYTWSSAVANNAVYNYTEQGYNAPNTICPKGWTLPTETEEIDDNTSWYYLYKTYGIVKKSYNSYEDNLKLRSVPLSATFGGMRNASSGEFSSLGRYTYYWTKTNQYNSAARNIVFGVGGLDQTDFSLQNYSYPKHYGLYIRCLANRSSYGYTINYSANGGSNAPSSSVGSGTSAPINDSTYPIRAGYSFLGYSTSSAASSPEYYPGDAIPLVSNLSITLYAVWAPITNTLASITTMQQMTPEICNGSTTPTMWDIKVPEATLRDTRDDKTYVVRKLADGNCWMAQNLRLGGSSPVNLFSSDTDLNTISSYTLPGEDTWYYNNSQAAYVNVPHLHASSLYSIITDNNGAVRNGSEIATRDSDIASSGTPTYQTQLVGNYYNFAAAIASNASSSPTAYDIDYNTEAPNSICPKGWQLPSGNSKSDVSYSYLYYNGYNLRQYSRAKISSSIVRTEPISLLAAGTYTGNGSTDNVGDYGVYWQTNVQFAIIYSTTSSPASSGGYGKGAGQFIRCVARKS